MQSLIDRMLDNVDMHRLEQTNRHGLSVAAADSCTGGLQCAAAINRNELEGKNAHSPAIDDAARRKSWSFAVQKRRGI